MTTTAATGGGFGKNLAHTDKSVRDKAVKALSEWLVQANDMDLLTMTKLWKGLFYCYWMSDKTLIQHELAEKLAGIILDLDTEKAVLYIQAFWKIIILEWPGLDRLRLDKFYNLLRNFHRHSFKLLEKCDFDEDLVNQYVALLEEGPVSSNNVRVPHSLKYHTAEVYLDEMNNGFAKEELPTEVGVTLLSPFIKAFATTTNKIYVDKLEEMFGKVVDVLDNNVRYEDEPEKKEFAVQLNNTRICQEIYKLIDVDTTLFKNRKSLNLICSRFFKEGGVKVEDVKGVQPVVQVGLRPLFSGKAPVSTPPTPPVTAALEEEKPSASTKSVAPIKAKETKIPVSVKSKEAKAAGKTQAASVAAAAAAASSSVSSSPSNQSTPEVVMAEASPKKETKKRNLKRPAEEAVSTPAALANEVENSTATTTSSTAAAEELKESPPKRVKLSQVADSLAQLKPQAVAIATKINTEKNARPLKIKATAAEIKELKLRALEAKRSGKMDEVVEVEKPVIEKPQVKKRGIVLKLENNTVKTYDRRLPIGMIPIELPPFSPSRSALKVTK